MVKYKKTLKCYFVGDIALGDHPKSVGFGFYSKYKQGIPLEKAETLFPTGIKADVIFGNLEFNIGEVSLSGTDFSHINCRGIRQYGEFLKAAGFNILNIANNHIFQYGRAEFDKTVKLLSSNNILIAGLKDDKDAKNKIQIDDQSIVFLAWSARPRQGFNCEPPYKEFKEDECYREIENAKSIADIICVSLHWGEEFIEIPSGDERRIARSMIDKGATIVLGHHPHVVREVEEYNGGLIAYSLGNFICDMTWNKLTAKTGLLSVDFEDGRIRGWEWIPGKIAEDFFPRYCNSPDSVTGDSYFAKSRRLKDKMSSTSYGELAKKALSHHRRLTLFHMLKNIHRYDRSILSEIICNALKSRFIKFIARSDN
ncbi:CapA family protein [Oryzomonas rubra]|uniref:CapA family protein n=1 Tax=Oryzomonas rubra TaxID=2509454 RepID=A0A5A9XFP7_9BACT|nr:CapA family protein [Oryzomonas rubra]KAA0890511.1 CapA family protein [Oryzomonas rubra]